MISERKYPISDQKILLISPEPWGINFISKHHYATQLSKLGNFVYFLDPPSNVNSILKKSANLFIIKYKPIIKGLRKFPTCISAYLVRREVEYLEKWLNVKFDIIWNFDTSRFFNLRRVTDKLRICHIVDWDENINRSLLCKSADIAFCTSEYLVKELKKFNVLSFNIGHGYNPSSTKLTKNEQKLLQSRFSINVGYVGNLSLVYIDWKVFYNLIIENSSVGFFFIGPEGKSNLSRNIVNDQYYYETKKLDNTIFLGEIEGEKIPAILSHFDILLLIYMGQKYKQQLSNPHKLLEYLGSGNVIVSSWTEEYKNNIGLITMLENNYEIPEKFKEISKNLNQYNSEINKKRRINFALENSYTNKICEIEELISNNIV